MKVYEGWEVRVSKFLERYGGKVPTVPEILEKHDIPLDLAAACLPPTLTATMRAILGRNTFSSIPILETHPEGLEQNCGEE